MSSGRWAWAPKISLRDWSTGENAFADIAAGIAYLTEGGFYGTYSLAVSPDLYMQMQRLQRGTGLLEMDRVAKLVDGRLYQSPALGKGTAVLTASVRANCPKPKLPPRIGNESRGQLSVWDRRSRGWENHRPETPGPPFSHRRLRKA